jgi:ADP-ribose pyrophosphatase YjhB (NUDIX family)
MHVPISPLEDETERVWKVYADGVEIKPQLLVVKSKYGEFTLGVRSEGYHGILYQEPSGGGAVTIPYCVLPNDRLVVGLVFEDRANLGNTPTPCALGGFLEAGESHDKTQARESAEEGGIDTQGASPLPGCPVIQDRAWYVADIKGGEGVRLYGLKIPYSDLEVHDAFKNTYCLRPEKLADTRLAGALVFLPFREAVLQTPDTVAHSLLLRLLIDLGAA